MNKNKTKGEKGTLLIVAAALLTGGVQAISSNNYITGVLFIAISILIFYIREHYKLTRWNKIEKEE